MKQTPSYQISVKQPRGGSGVYLSVFFLRFLRPVVSSEPSLCLFFFPLTCEPSLSGWFFPPLVDVFFFQVARLIRHTAAVAFFSTFNVFFFSCSSDVDSAHSRARCSIFFCVSFVLWPFFSPFEVAWLIRHTRELLVLFCPPCLWL